MGWKNQLTKTPYLVLFMVLISVGVGTASALITITLAGNVIITDDLTVDTDTLFVDSSTSKVGIGTTAPSSALHVRGSGSDFTPNQQGIQLTGSDASGNVGIELTGNGKSTYIDFQNDTDGTDFDARIILKGDDKLSIEGASLEVNEIIASPIVGSWSPDSDTSNGGVEFVIWDIEEENTNSNYYGFIAGSDSIQIKKSGYYRVTAHVTYSNFLFGVADDIIWDIARHDSDGIKQETICQILNEAGPTSHSSSCSAIEFFNDNDRVKLFDATDASIQGHPTNGALTFLDLERLN